MPTAFAADVLRRPVILIAAWLIVLQAFLVGVATAQAAVMSAPAKFDAGVICHGPGGGGGAADAPAPGADKVLKLCCTFCGTPSHATAPLDPPKVAPIVSWERAHLPALASFTLTIARGAVRAGRSQAPPQVA